MEFFGVTMLGFSNPIKDMLRPDYEEPKSLQENLKLEPKTGSRESFSEKIREVDCYIGYADGYAYGSNDRLCRMRKKYVLKPVGPTDMYKYPGTNGMVCGWWQADPDLIAQVEEGGDWFRPRVVHSIKTSERTRSVGYAEADWAGSEDDRKSTSGYLFQVFHNCSITWNSRKQSTVAASSTKAEYMSVFEAIREAIYGLNL